VAPPDPSGVFTAGAATGPMSIAESISSAEQAVWDILRYLEANGPVCSLSTG
jgi:heterodisulfide reductase subunit A-like polyferredoxin